MVGINTATSSATAPARSGWNRGVSIRLLTPDARSQGYLPLARAWQVRGWYLTSSCLGAPGASFTHAETVGEGSGESSERPRKRVNGGGVYPMPPDLSYRTHPPRPRGNGVEKPWRRGSRG